MSEHTKQTSKHIECIIPGCGFQASAPTEEELLKKVAEHAGHDHGVTELSPELVSQVKAAIVTR